MYSLVCKYVVCLHTSMHMNAHECTLRNMNTMVSGLGGGPGAEAAREWSLVQLLRRVHLQCKLCMCVLHGKLTSMRYFIRSSGKNTSSVYV